jgi:Sec-independent protein secretion pathway component TatC
MIKYSELERAEVFYLHKFNFLQILHISITYIYICMYMYIHMYIIRIHNLKWEISFHLQQEVSQSFRWTSPLDFFLSQKNVSAP